MKYARKAKRKNAAAERKQRKKDAKHPEFKINIGDGYTFRYGVDGINSYQDGLNRAVELEQQKHPEKSEEEVLGIEPATVEGEDIIQPAVAPEEPVEFVEAENLGVIDED